MTIKFMYNGIKANGVLHKAHYSKGGYRTLPEETITIYARGYESFPEIEGLTVENDTDIMTDYFAKDRIRVLPDNKFYDQVYAAYQRQQGHREKRGSKRLQAVLGGISCKTF